MNQSDKFFDTVGILVKAYLNDTLEATDCAKCAVGNMVAAANGYKLGYNKWYDDNEKEVDVEWETVVWNLKDGGYWTENGLSQIAATGYSIEHFAGIEHAFMYPNDSEAEDYNYAGLMSVVDYLASIHGIDIATATEAKALFVKA